MKVITLSLLVIVVGLLFLNVWQSYRYEESLRLIRGMERQQEEWVDKNRKVEAAEALLDNPARLDQLAEGSLGLKKADPKQMLHIQLPAEDAP